MKKDNQILKRQGVVFNCMSKQLKKHSWLIDKWRGANFFRKCRLKLWDFLPLWWAEILKTDNIWCRQGNKHTLHMLSIINVFKIIIRRRRRNVFNFGAMFAASMKVQNSLALWPKTFTSRHLPSASTLPCIEVCIKSGTHKSNEGYLRNGENLETTRMSFRRGLMKEIRIHPWYGVTCVWRTGKVCEQTGKMTWYLIRLKGKRAGVEKDMSIIPLRNPQCLYL